MAKETFIQPRFLGTRFDEKTLPLSAARDLGDLKDGWLEGRGKAPNSLYLSMLADDLAEAFPPGIDYPAVVPTEEGNVCLEWIKPTARIELEANYAGNLLELYASDLEADTFIEESYDKADWAGAFAKIKSLLG